MTAPATNTFLNSSTTRPTYAAKVQPGIWVDQYGRAFAGNLDKNTGHPSGACLPEGWEPPHPSLIPPMKYYRFGARRDGRLFVDIDAWRTDYAQAWKGWREERTGIAVKEYKDAAAAEMERDNPILMDMVGPTPLHPEFLDAMLPMDANFTPVKVDTATPADWARSNNWVLGRRNRRGEMAAQPAWATAAVMKTLAKHEAATTATTPQSLSRFANDEDDELDEDAAEIADRLDGAARHEALEDAVDPPLARGSKGQFQKRGT